MFKKNYQSLMLNTQMQEYVCWESYEQYISAVLTPGPLLSPI